MQKEDLLKFPKECLKRAKGGLYHQDYMCKAYFHQIKGKGRISLDKGSCNPRHVHLVCHLCGCGPQTITDHLRELDHVLQAHNACLGAAYCNLLKTPVKSAEIRDHLPI